MNRTSGQLEKFRGNSNRAQDSGVRSNPDGTSFAQTGQSNTDQEQCALVAGTDGTDGPTDAAGAIVDGDTWDISGAIALERADAAPWLDAKGALFCTGPTGTNVMDLLIAECWAP